MRLATSIGRWILTGLVTCGVVAGLFTCGLVLGFMVLKPARPVAAVSTRPAASATPLPLLAAPTQPAPQFTHPPLTTPTQPPAAAPAAGAFTPEPILSLEFEPLTPAIAQAEGLAVSAGAVIRRLAGDGRGAEAGLRVGDVIRGVNGLPVDEGHGLADVIVSQHMRGALNLLVWRAGQTLLIEVNLILNRDEVQG